MMKKSKRQTFSYLRRESPLEKQGVKFDSLLAHGCTQGVKALFQHPVRTCIKTPYLLPQSSQRTQSTAEKTPEKSKD
jgi:hypothetical protein